LPQRHQRDQFPAIHEEREGSFDRNMNEPMIAVLIDDGISRSGSHDAVLSRGANGTGGSARLRAAPSTHDLTAEGISLTALRISLTP